MFPPLSLLQDYQSLYSGSITASKETAPDLLNASLCLQVNPSELLQAIQHGQVGIATKFDYRLMSNPLSWPGWTTTGRTRSPKYMILYMYVCVFFFFFFFLPAVQLQMLLFPNALCCSLYERNCVCAVTKIFTKFLPANNFANF